MRRASQVAVKCGRCRSISVVIESVKTLEARSDPAAGVAWQVVRRYMRCGRPGCGYAWTDDVRIEERLMNRPAGTS